MLRAYLSLCGGSLAVLKKPALVFCFCGGFFVFSGYALAWGRDGHKIVAGIAHTKLSPEARNWVKSFAGGQSLSALAVWPDGIRSQSRWKHTGPWHYISVEDHQDILRIRHASKGDVLVALGEFERLLRSIPTSQAKSWRGSSTVLLSQRGKHGVFSASEVLAFYIHFIADVHQPLHVGRAKDKGGNTIQARWFGRRSNLHRIWDSGFIDQKGLSVDNYVSLLLSEYAGVALNNVRGPFSYAQWANESHQLRKAVYEFRAEGSSSKPQISGAYYRRNIALVEKRLWQAGVRLADALNALAEEAAASKKSLWRYLKDFLRLPSAD